MTREEAKEILTHNWTRVDNPNYTYEELDEAFHMAIEALKADALLEQEIDFHKKVSRIEAEKVVDLEHEFADMVSVVRCKDCRQYYPYDLTKTYGWCCESKTIIEEDEFCSRGERSTK